MKTVRCKAPMWGLLIIADTCRSMSGFVFNTEAEAAAYRDKILGVEGPSLQTYLVAKLEIIHETENPVP